MIELYTKQEIDELTPEELKDGLSPFQFTKEGLLWVPSKNAVRAKKLLELKKIAEYKYCMPICVKEGGLLFGAYSTHLFLSMCIDNIRCGKKRRIYLEALLREHRRSKITLYAAGGIEKAPDHGVGYRKDLKTCLKMTRARIINPCDFKYNKEHISLTEYGKHHDIDDYYRQCEKTVVGDLEAVLNADAIVLNIDQYLGSGSTSEITVAKATNKPVYGIVAEGYDLKEMNPWAFGNVSRFFNGMNAFREFLIGAQE